jgi:hypothetical protein
MQDISTSMVVMVGQPGMGKSSLASDVARYLVGSGHWAEAYWADMQGVGNNTTAGHQLAAALGLHGDTPDPARWGTARRGAALRPASTCLPACLPAPPHPTHTHLLLLGWARGAGRCDGLALAGWGEPQGAGARPRARRARPVAACRVAAWLEASPVQSALGLVVVHGDALLQHPEEQGAFLEQLDRLMRGQRRLQVGRALASTTPPAPASF